MCGCGCGCGRMHVCVCMYTSILSNVKMQVANAATVFKPESKIK